VDLLIILSRIILLRAATRGGKHQAYDNRQRSQYCPVTSDQRFPPRATSESEGFKLREGRTQEFLLSFARILLIRIFDDFGVDASPISKQKTMVKSPIDERVLLKNVKEIVVSEIYKSG